MIMETDSHRCEEIIKDILVYDTTNKYRMMTVSQSQERWENGTWRVTMKNQLENKSNTTELVRVTDTGLDGTMLTKPTFNKS